MAKSIRIVYLVPYWFRSKLQICGIKINETLPPVTPKVTASVSRFLKYVFVARYKAGIKIPCPEPDSNKKSNDYF